jgi:hypothetical protein
MKVNGRGLRPSGKRMGRCSFQGMFAISPRAHPHGTEMFGSRPMEIWECGRITSSQKSVRIYVAKGSVDPVSDQRESVIRVL